MGFDESPERKGTARVVNLTFMRTLMAMVDGRPEPPKSRTEGRGGLEPRR